MFPTHPSCGCLRSGARPVRHGFTLLELLVVVAIIALLGALMIPALQGTLSGIDLKGGSSILFSEFDLARQTASTRNVAVDIRLYQNPNEPKDSNGNFPYRYVGLVISQASSGAAADEFIGTPQSLRGDVIIDSNPTYSSLLNTALLPQNPAPAQTEATTAPLMVQGKPYVRFLFLPNGTLNLASSNSSGATIAWTLTLINEHDRAATVAGAPASNYVTMVLDVATARARIYQP